MSWLAGGTAVAFLVQLDLARLLGSWLVVGAAAVAATVAVLGVQHHASLSRRDRPVGVLLPDTKSSLPCGESGFGKAIIG